MKFREKKPCSSICSLFLGTERVSVFILDSHMCVWNVLHFNGMLGQSWLCQKFYVGFLKSLCKRMCKCVIYLIWKKNALRFRRQREDGPGRSTRLLTNQRLLLFALPFSAQMFFFFSLLHRPSWEKLSSIRRKRKKSNPDKTTTTKQFIYIVPVERKHRGD